MKYRLTVFALACLNGMTALAALCSPYMREPFTVAHKAGGFCGFFLLSYMMAWGVDQMIRAWNLTKEYKD